MTQQGETRVVGVVSSPARASTGQIGSARAWWCCTHVGCAATTAWNACQ
ncbi:MAG: hypothetical protein ACYC0T_04510 [Ramlibacter sp.]